MNVHFLTLAYFSIQAHSQHPCHRRPSPISSHLPSFRPSANLPIAVPTFLPRSSWDHCLKGLPTAFPHFCQPRSSSSFQGCSLPKISSLSPGRMTSCLSGPLVFGWYPSQDSACGPCHSPLCTYFTSDQSVRSVEAEVVPD